MIFGGVGFKHGLGKAGVVLGTVAVVLGIVGVVIVNNAVDDINDCLNSTSSTACD